MSEVNEGSHAIDLCVVVLGSASDLFLDSLTNVERQGDAVSMHLGSMQGWKPTLRFYGFGHDPWAGDGAEGERLSALVPKMDALVLTDGQGHGYSDTAIERLARTLKPAKIGVPSAVFGSAVLAQEWATQANRAPVHQAEPEATHAMAVVKAIAKPMLKALQSRK